MEKEIKYVKVPADLMQEIANYLLECKAKEVMGMLLALKSLEAHKEEDHASSLDK